MTNGMHIWKVRGNRFIYYLSAVFSYLVEGMDFFATATFLITNDPEG